MPLLLSRILNKPLWTGWMLCRLLADPKHPVQRWMPHTSIECASLCSQSSVTTCSEANIVPTVNLSLALYLPFFSPSLQHPRASTHIRFLAFCSILKSSWLRSFLGYKKKKKETPWSTKTLWSVHMYCVFWSYKCYCICESKNRRLFRTGVEQSNVSKLSQMTRAFFK